MSVARFPIRARLGRASVEEAGTLAIDRDTGLCTIRAHRRRTVYELPVSEVASLVVRQIIRAEVQATYKAGRKPRRGRL